MAAHETITVDVVGVELRPIRLPVWGVTYEELLGFDLQTFSASIDHPGTEPEKFELILEPETDLYALCAFLKRASGGRIKMPTTVGHPRTKNKCKVTPLVNYTAVIDEIAQKGHCVVRARVRNVALVPSACYVAVPRIGDDHVYHHKDETFTVNALMAEFNKVFLYLEPGSCIEADIYFYPNEKRSEMVRFGPERFAKYGFTRVIGKQRLENGVTGLRL